MSIRAITNRIGYRNLPGYLLGRAALRTGEWINYSRAANSIGEVANRLKLCPFRHELTRESLAEILYKKLDFDAETARIIDQIKNSCSLNIEEHACPGLVNFETGEIHLIDSCGGRICAHDDVAQKWGIKENNARLKDGWYAFTILQKQSDQHLAFNPKSNQYGQMPIEFAPIFENYMQQIFGDACKDRRFYQLNYKRRISAEDIDWLNKTDRKLAEKSESDKDLLIRLQAMKDALAGAIVQEINDSDFENEVIMSSMPVIVKFYTDRCDPCRKLAPTFDGIAEEFSGKARFVKINIDKNPKTYVLYSVRSVPTLLLFNNGRVIDQVVGFLPKQRLSHFLLKILAGIQSG